MWYHDIYILASLIFGDFLVTVCAVLIMFDLYILASLIFGDSLVTVCSVLIMFQGKRLVSVCGFFVRIHVVQGIHLSRYALSRNRIISGLNFVETTCAWLRVFIQTGSTDVIVLWICHGFGFDEKGHRQCVFSLLPPAIAFLVTYRCPFSVPFVIVYHFGRKTVLMDEAFLCFLVDVLH